MEKSKFNGLPAAACGCRVHFCAHLQFINFTTIRRARARNVGHSAHCFDTFAGRVADFRRARTRTRARGDFGKDFQASEFASAAAERPRGTDNRARPAR